MSSIKIELGGYQPPTSVHNRAAEIFGEELAKRVGDAVDYAMDGNMPESKGIKAFDLPALVEAGDLTMCYFASSYLAERVPEVAIFDLPFVVKSREKAYAALDGELGDLFKEKFLSEMGVRILGFWDNGFRHFTNGVREIRTENPLTNTYRFGTYHYHRHITLTGHFFGMVLVMVNNEIFESWPDNVQKAVQDSIDIATKAQRGFAQAEDDEVMAALDPAENDVVELSDDERQAFQDAVTPLVAKHRARLGDRLFELVE
jgi:TRAP-type transport system periplasmic protein